MLILTSDKPFYIYNRFYFFNLKVFKSKRDEKIMSIEQDIVSSIESQFILNKNKNIFSPLGALKFSFETLSMIENRRDELKRALSYGGKESLIDMMAEQAEKEFCSVNQYADFRKTDILFLKSIYGELLDDISSSLDKDIIDYARIEKNHTARMAEWLYSTNTFLAEINLTDREYASSAICSEYTAEFQIHVLGIDLNSLTEPVIDIGCGENAHLVEYLRDNCFKAYGLDRICKTGSEYIFKKNWFEYKFEPEKWGTILSNLSFASHFINNNLRGDGNHAEYASKYMEILSSLKPGGKFHYAPGISFIEKFLPTEKYNVESVMLNEYCDRTIITRIL
jgi:hypothetical protein